jgi:hypothetical protein
VPAKRPSSSLPLFPVSDERARELVRTYGLDNEIYPRPRFCPPRRNCPTCTGKRARGHGPYYQANGVYLGSEENVRELKAARALLAPEFEELERRREAILNPQKAASAGSRPTLAGGAGAATPTTQERKAARL